MGKIDTAAIKYLRQNEIFADVFNYYLYQGEKVIHPDSLEEMDTREIEVPYGGEQGAEEPIQKTRDIVRTVVAMTDRRTAYLVLGVESQAMVNYAMPVRDMLYDALQYTGQVQKATASHRKTGDYRGKSSDEYLSGWQKEDRLMPVVTLVIYWSSREWDGPMSLREMFVGSNDSVLSCVPDYRINLLQPATIRDDDLAKFGTTLKEVLTFIKYAQDADKLKEAVNADEKFRHLGRNEVDILNVSVKANLTIEEREEECDVCEAMQELADRAAAEGRAEGRAEGVRETCIKLYKKGWTAEELSDLLNYSVDTVREWLQTN